MQLAVILRNRCPERLEVKSRDPYVLGSLFFYTVLAEIKDFARHRSWYYGGTNQTRKFRRRYLYCCSTWSLGQSLGKTVLTTTWFINSERLSLLLDTHCCDRAPSWSKSPSTWMTFKCVQICCPRFYWIIRFHFCEGLVWLLRDACCRQSCRSCAAYEVCHLSKCHSHDRGHPNAQYLWRILAYTQDLGHPICA